MTAEAIPPGGTRVGDPLWEPWRPEDITRLLAGATVPWYVAGGWALDLMRGEQTREHGDLEIGVPAPRFGAVRDALAGYEFEVAGSGHLWPLESPAFEMMHQTWISEPVTGVYRLDIFREPEVDGEWLCRRDETIRLPYERIIRRTAADIPYLIPELVLLFKAKYAAEAKHQADFDAALPLLDAGAIDWLAQALARVHPGHRWIEAAAGARGQAGRRT